MESTIQSWEDQMVDQTIEKTSKLNVNAKEFVPQFLISQPSVATEAPAKEENVSGDCLEEKQAKLPKTEMKESNEKSVYQENVILSQSKEYVNVVFIGHVDAGKSTIGGHILYLTGMIDSRDVEKNMKKAKEMNRESWYLSWALDVNEEERAKGKTVECGRSYFETEKKHFCLLDAPGHKLYVQNMISGSSQADIAILVISARIGEFEAGFEKGGQTQEHTILVKTAGVKRLVVLINKMDDPSVDWNEDRYNECRNKLIPFLKKTGFNPKADVHFMPCSGYKGSFIKEAASESECPWYRGPCLLQYLNDMPPLDRTLNGPLRMSVLDKYKDMGMFIVGKIESGVLNKGQLAVLMPIEKSIEVVQITKDEEDVATAIAGDNVKVKVRNVEEEEISPGFVLCSQNSFCKASRTFDAQILVGDIPSIICAGYTAIMHVHSLAREVSIKRILAVLDKKNPKVVKEKFPRFFKSGDLVMVRFEVTEGTICIENFKDFPQMGRFILREKVSTIAQGKIMKIFPLGPTTENE